MPLDLRGNRNKRLGIPLNQFEFEVREVSKVSEVSVIRGGKPSGE